MKNEVMLQNHGGMGKPHGVTTKGDMIDCQGRESGKIWGPNYRPPELTWRHESGLAIHDDPKKMIDSVTKYTHIFEDENINIHVIFLFYLMVKFIAFSNIRIFFQNQK